MLTFQIIPYHHKTLCLKTLVMQKLQRILFDDHAERAHWTKFKFQWDHLFKCLGSWIWIAWCGNFVFSMSQFRGARLPCPFYWGIWRETKPPPVTYTTCKVDVSCILPTLQKLQHVLLSLKIFDIPQLNMLSILAFCQVCDGGADKMEMKVRAPATTKKVAVSSPPPENMPAQMDFIFLSHSKVGWE